MKKIIWCCFAACVDVAMSESEEKVHTHKKRRKMVRCSVSFHIPPSLGSAIFDASIRPE